MRRRLLDGSGCSQIIDVIDKIDTVAGDICIVDNNTLDKYFIEPDTIELINPNCYTPIGVVVVPASHTDDGTVRLMSLASMDYNNPDNGNTIGHIEIAWGGYNSDVPDLSYKTAMPYITNTNYAGIGSTQQLVGWRTTSGAVPEMSSDYYDNSYPNPFDEGACFGRDYGMLAPSPYLTGGGKNEIYHSIANTGNVYADMDGKGNTEKILAVDNGVSTSWQTASTITNNTSNSTNTQPHTAAQCCWRYHTFGTQQGDWYLPAGGELGYLASRWKAINTSINKIISSGFEALALPVGYSLGSSTENSTLHAMGLYFYSGYACLYYYSTKNYSRYVRAFLAV